jgi:hypothetical protein
VDVVAPRLGHPDPSITLKVYAQRHYLASLLIATGLDVKVVQAWLRHASAKTTLDTYGHLWPDADESARAAIGAVLAARGLCADYGGRLTNQQATCQA